MRPFSRSRFQLPLALLIAFSLLALQIAVLIPNTPPAAANTPFAPVFSTNAPGDIVYVTNTLATCATGSANCAAAQAGGNFSNNSFGGNMTYVDVDADGTTVNSSSATYDLPAGGTVLWAGLYWSGWYTGAAADKDDVLLETPASGGYVPLTATFFDDWDNNDDYYMGFVDVTSLVQTGGSGVYTVADAAITPASGNTFGGWSIVVVHEDPAASWKNLTVNHGFNAVTSSIPFVDLTVSGFTAPPVGPVNAEIGIIAGEGDVPFTGDYAEFNGTRLTNGVNPTDNFFNSSLSSSGVLTSGTNPTYPSNTLGFDADIIATSGLVPTSATSATVRVGTVGDWYFPTVVTTAIEIYVPNLTTNLQKTGLDLNGELAHPGDEIEYTITFDNTGEDPAINTVVSDTIPNGTTYVPGSLTVVSDDSPAGARTDAMDGDTAWFDGTAVNFNIGVGADGTNGGQVDPLSQGGRVYEVTFRVTVDEGVEGSTISNIGQIDYTAQFLGDDFTATTAAVEHLVEPLVDLSLTKSDTPDPAFAGNTISYTVTASNAGPSTAQDVTIVDTLPPGLTFTAAGSDPGCSAAGQVVTCLLGALAPGSQSATINAVVGGDVVVASVTNSATVSSSTHEHELGDNTDSEPTALERQVDLTVVKTAPTQVVAGQQVTYSISVTNAGPSTALNTVLVDALPTDVVLVSATPSGAGSCTGGVECTWPEVAAGATETVSILVDVPAGLVAGTTLTNSASATSDDPEANAADNSDTATTTVANEADLSIDKQLASGPIIAGEKVTYAVVVSNLGPSGAENVVVTDAVPTNLTFDPTLSASECSLNTGTVTCTSALLPANGTQSFSLVFDVDPGVADGANITNTASVTSDAIDNVSANDTDTQVDPSARQIDVWVVKDDNTTTVNAGGQLTYSLSYGNNGPSVASNVTLVDTLSSDVTFNSSADCTFSAPATVTCAVGTLAPGQTGTANFVVDVDGSLIEPASISNSATISATETDPVSTNDTSSVTTDVNRTVTLNVEKSDLADPVIAGETVTYTLLMTNLGPSTETNAVLSDPLPAGMTFVSVADPGICAVASNVVTCTVGTMAPGEVFTTNVVARIDTSLDDGTILTNQIFGDGDVSEPIDDSEQTTASTEADVSVTKSAVATVIAGEPLVYTVTASNAGPSDAKNTIVTDAIPVGTTYSGYSVTSGTAVCTESAGMVTCDLGDLVASGSTTIDITVDVDPSLADGSRLTNNASITTTTFDTDSGNDTATADTDVIARTDLSTTKTTLTTPILAGTTATFQVAVTNNGPSTATNVAASDTLPPGFTFTATGSSAGCAAGVTCSAGTLLPGETATFTIVADVGAAVADGTWTNTATATGDQIDPDAGNDTAISTIDIQQQADVQIVKLADDAVLVPGTDETWTLTVRNNGPSLAENVMITDTLPPGLTFSGASSSECVAGVTCTIGDMAPGAEMVISLVASVDANTTGPINNTATVASNTPDPTQGNNTSTDSTPILAEADISITKSGPAAARAGDQIAYTFTVSNAGPSRADNIVISDVLPSAMSFVPAGSSPECSTGVSCTISALNPGDSATLTIVVDIADDVADNTTLTNDASVTSAATDTDPSNNSSAADTDVTREADLQISKTGPATAAPGTSVTYSITATNSGPSLASAVIISDTMPADTTATSVAAVGASCSNLGISFECSTPTLAPGASITITVDADISLDATDGATIVNSAAVAANETDPATSNNTATAPTVLVASADVSIVKTSSPASPVAGDQLTYTLTITNAGPSNAETIEVLDNFPSTLTIDTVSSPDMICTTTGQSIDCDSTLLIAGDTTTVTVVADIDPGLASGSDVVNTATATSSTSDPDMANNTSTDTATIDAAADLGIIKTTTKPTAVAGEFQPWTITVGNNGPSTATNVIVSDTLPAGTTFNTTLSDSSCTESAGVATCTVGTLIDQESVAFVIVVDVPTDHPDASTLTNTASVAGDQNDPISANNSDDQAVPVANIADLSIVKDGDNAAVAGDTYTWTLDIANNGPSNAVNTVVVDTLPSGTTFAAGSDPRCVDGAGTITCTIGSLAAGDSDQLLIVVDVASGVGEAAPLNNTATISSSTSDPDPGDNSSSDTATATRVSDLDITKRDLADPVIAGEEVAWEVTVENRGPSDAANVTIVDTLPSGVQFSSVDDARCSESAGVVSCAIASLVAGDSVTVIIRADVDPAIADATVLNNSATADSPSSSAVTATEDTTVQRRSDVSITKTSDGGAIAGTQHTYTVSVSNAGPSNADNIVVTDLLPAGFTFSSATDPTCSATGPVVTCTRATLAVGVPFTFDLIVDVADSAQPTSRNNITVSSDSVDPDPSNDDDDDETTVTAEADLAVVKTLTSGTPVPGTQAVWDVVVTNNGPSEAPGVTVVDVLDPALTFDATTSSTNCTALDQTVTCSEALLLNGESVTFTISTDIDPSLTGQITNGATVSSSVPDPNPADDESTITVTVAPDANLEVDKQGMSTDVVAGEPLLYEISVVNNGPSDAVNIAVSDPVPTGLAFNPSTSSPECVLDVSGTQIECNTTLLAPTEASAFTVGFLVDPDVPAGTLITNVASANADTSDSDPTNNEADATIPADRSVDLSIDKSLVEEAVTPGLPANWVLTVTNSGPSIATDVTATDVLPEGLLWVSAGSDSRCTNAGQTVTCVAGSLPVGETTTFAISTMARVDLALGEVTNSASVIAEEGGETAAEITVPVEPNNATLRVEKSTNDERVTVGDTIRWTIVVTNEGPEDITVPLQMEDVLPSGLQFESVAEDGPAECINADQTITCSVEALAVGEALTFELETTSMLAGEIVNVVSVGGAGLGEDREVSAAAAAVVVIATSPSVPLALTGQTISGLVTLGTLLLIGGASLVLFERREDRADI